MAIGPLLLVLVLAGCGSAEQGDAQGGDTPKGSHGSDAVTSTQASGEAFAEADLEPVGDSGTSGMARFRGLGSTDVQVDLAVSGLPNEDPDAVYYAQVHEGNCSDERESEDPGHEGRGHGGGTGTALGLVRFDRLLAKASGLRAHGGDEPGIPEAPYGSIEQPVGISASADSTGSVVTVFRGVGPERLSSGGPKYMHLHAVRSEGAPEEELACGDLQVAGESG